MELCMSNSASFCSSGYAEDCYDMLMEVPQEFLGDNFNLLGL